jgi:hypothetical protein
VFGGGYEEGEGVLCLCVGQDANCIVPHGLQLSYLRSSAAAGVAAMPRALLLLCAGFYRLSCCLVCVGGYVVLLCMCVGRL